MSRDEGLVMALVVAFAALVTVHLSLVAALARGRAGWRAIVALVVAPLAPVWGYQERLRVRSALWVLSAAVYVTARILGSR
jgi:hypothetical protein